MSRPGFRSSIARLRNYPPSPDVMHIDYADVLAQAVINERHRLLREIRDGLEAIRVTEYTAGSYRPSREGEDVKADALRVLANVGQG